MTARVIRYPAVLTLPAAAGGLVALAAAAPTPHLASALSCLVVVVGLAIWPWAALPVAVIGGFLVSSALGRDEVDSVVAVHAALLALGFLAVGLRRAADPTWRRVDTVADGPMIALACAVVLGAAYALVIGNDAYDVMVATYHVGVIPAYFFLGTLTLSSPRRLRAAGVVFVTGATAIALAEVATPGRHGGLFSALALIPALAAASRVDGGRRWLLVAMAAVLGLDVMLAAYRAIWVATAVALLLLMAARVSGLRATVAWTLACGLAVAFVAGGAASNFESRTEVVAAAFEQSSGYRIPEARIGIETFLANPIVGDGLGQVSHHVFIEGFGITDVGPIYHTFYVTLLANGGLVVLGLVLWPLVRAFNRARRSTSVQAQAFAAALAGFAVAAAFSAPTDGHWELGLLAALALIAARFPQQERAR